MKNKLDKNTEAFLTTYVDLLVSGNPHAEGNKGVVMKVAKELLDEHIDKVKNDPNYEVPKSEIGDAIDELAKSVKKVVDKQELIKEVMGKIIKKTYPPEIKGGQHAGVSSGVTLYCEEFEIEISIHAHHSRYKNLQLAITLMELALDDLIK
jgi:hypothetical protein